MVSPIPDKESEASNVTFFLLFLGIDPLARFPLGALAYKRVRAMFDPHSSRKMKLLLSSFFTFSLHSIRSSSFLSLASNVFFRVHPEESIARLMVMMLILIPLSFSQRSQCS